MTPIARSAADTTTTPDGSARPDATRFRVGAPLAMPRAEPRLWISAVGAITLSLAMLAGLVVLH